MAMRPVVSYTPYDISLRGKTSDIITFAHFEEGDLLSETRDNKKAVTSLMTIQLCYH